MYFILNKLHHSFLRCGRNLIYSRQCCKKTIYDIKIGKVTKSVSLPKNPHLVPILYLPKTPSETLLNHLLWIMKKDILGQDMFLIGSPGPHRARVVLQYLELMQREVEYVILSRDTTENDLKQRREIYDGTAHYIDQSAVRAAVEGRFLILDGIEKVERNVLPVLNNLLENREMQLEDGRFLVAPERYDKLLLEHSKKELDNWKLVRVSENFRVVALGLPVPQFKGNPLDPPFRSRFQAHHLKIGFEEQLSEFSESLQNIQKDELKRFLSACHTLLTEESSNLDLPKFPVENLPIVLNILNKLPSFPMGHTFKWIYPYPLILQKSAQNLVKETLQKFSIKTGSTKAKADVSRCSDNADFTHLIKFKTNKNTFKVNALGKNNIDVQSVNFVSNAYHDNILADLCLTHLSHDFCIVGNKGSGKGTLTRKFATLFDYPVEMVMLYNDMTARDLLQQRITDEKGNTLWRPSQVVRAAKAGKLLVLDGLHRIHSSTLSVLQTLVHDREIQLYDGTKLIRYDRFDALKNKLNLSDKELEAKNIFRIHPAFRIVALAEPPKIQSTKENWLNPQVLSLFLFHEIRPLNMEEEKTVIKSITNCPSDKIDILLNFTHKLRNSEDDVLKNVSTSFSTRQLVRMARRLVSFPHESIYDLIKQSCLFEFLPQLTKQGVESVLESCSIAKPKPSLTKRSIRVINKELYIGNTKFLIYDAGADKLKVPNVLFYDSPEHVKIMESILQDFILGEHLLLVGNQGVGKNKITDRFLQLINRPREYIQLHRDTTVQSLTQQPTVKDGRIIYEDSPLLKAVKFGRVLVVDEADKAPTHVTSILKALVVSGEMTLSDGRCIVHQSDCKIDSKDQVVMHPDFRMIVLANRPGFPFLGNDFFSTLGDIFSCHAVENPSLESEVTMLQQYGPNVPENYLRKLANLFAELHAMSDAGLISYPYSTREVVNIIKHLNKFPEEGIPFVLKNVFDFDVFNSELKDTLSKIFIKHGIPFDKQTVSVNVAKRYKLPQKTITEWELSREIHVLETKNHKLNLGNKCHLATAEAPIYNSEPRASVFSEQQSFYQLPLKHNDVPLDIKATCIDGADILYVVTANPFSLYRINIKAKLMSSVNLSGYFPNLRSGYKPEIFTSIINSSDNDLILLHEKLTNQTFLVNVKEGIMNRININSFFDEAISKLSNIMSNKSSQFFELCEFPSKKKVVMFQKNDQKIILLNFDENSTCQLNFPDKIQSIYVKDDYSLLINCEKDNFFIDLTNSGNWKARLLQSERDEIIDIKTIDKEDLQSVSLMSSPTNYACLVTGSFLLDDKLEITKFPRESKLFVDHKANCIMPLNQQIVRFVHELPSHIKYDGSQNNAGFLEIVDLKNSTYTYIDANIPFNSSSFANWLINTSKSYLLMCLLQNETLVTIDVRGCIRKWEVSEQSLVQSFEEWRRMIGAENEQQLTIERIDKNEVSNPKHGKVDPTGAPHVGGNTWAGGTGGRDTAGLGGRGGPYRLDAGHNVYQVPDYMKDAVPPEVRKAAREMNRKAYKEKLKEIQMSEYDAELYSNFLNNVENQVKSLRVILDSLQAKSRERQWLRHQTSGEFDDTKLIEGITGEKSIYKKRGLQEPEMGSPQEKPKLLRLVVDVSGSMYRFNGHDHRLERELECVVLLMEAFENYNDKFQYQIVGHSGEEFCYEFSKFGQPPKNRKERLDLLRNMIAHSQFCASGDNTLEATEQAIKSITKIEADEYFVIVMSDANFDRYGIPPESFAKLLVADPKVNAFAIFIGSLGDQATILKKQLPPGRGFVCFDSSDLTQILQKIFTSALLKD